MKPLALICLILIAMSPTALKAFGQIAGAKIISGVMDLHEHFVVIHALGIREGMLWQISTIWIGGRPGDIWFTNPRPML